MSSQEKTDKNSADSAPGDLVCQESVAGEGWCVELLTDEPSLAAFLKVTTSHDDSPPKAEEVLEFLKEQNLTLADKERAQVSTTISQATKKGVYGPIRITQGTLPVDGVDGSVQWHVARPNMPKALSSPSASVDYKDRFALVNVRRGQQILKITEPTKGMPGKDVFGREIPFKEGTPAEFRTGKNVESKGSSGTMIALTDGYVDVASGTVSVEPVLLVQKDVDLAVGNIDFIGPVKINGDVLDGFHVKAGQGIEVSGMVEGAVLEAGAAIEIKGGVAGKGKGRITCAQGFQARYVNDVAIEAGGDVIVQNSIVSCTVKSLGSVEVASGGIRGANVVAKHFVRSPEIGSEVGVRTIVIVGVDYGLKDDLVNLERELAVVKENQVKIRTALGPLVRNPELVSKLPKPKAEAAEKLMAQLKKLNEMAVRLTTKRDACTEQMSVEDNVWIEVDKMIFPGVMMQIGTCRRTFEVEVPGPLKVVPEPESGSLRIRR